MFSDISTVGRVALASTLPGLQSGASLSQLPAQVAYFLASFAPFLLEVGAFTLPPLLPWPLVPLSCGFFLLNIGLFLLVSAIFTSIVLCLHSTLAYLCDFVKRFLLVAKNFYSSAFNIFFRISFG
jgi:hypothetical protein